MEYSQVTAVKTADNTTIDDIAYFRQAQIPPISQLSALYARARRTAARIIFFLREYFFPAGCALCDSALLDLNETWYGICEKCHAELSQEIAWMDGADAMENRCNICGKPMVSGKGDCLSCRNGQERSYDQMLTVFSYSGKYRKLFGAYKFGKHLALGHFFAEIIIKACQLLQAAESENPLHIAPVPPRPGKIKTDGWDQVEYLARLIEAGRADAGQVQRSAFPLCRCLKRLASQVQKKLKRNERLQNLSGKIVMTRQPPPAVVIIDDVITTGSTMDACASALKAGGACKVYGICLVYN